MSMNVRLSANDENGKRNIGELRIGRELVATLATWSKSAVKRDGRKLATVVFTTRKVNQFWADFGPPTVVLLVLPTRREYYDVESGDIRAGALTVKVPPRVERS